MYAGEQDKIKTHDQNKFKLGKEYHTLQQFLKP